jgi:nucleoside 2-deoxyribosyltransferase
MPTSAVVFTVLLAGATDVAQEQETAARVVEEWNRHHGRAGGTRLEVLHWKLDAYPAAGAHPQQIINTQLVDKADIVVAIFWTRFGTPTPNAGSGTVEEIERSIAAGKRVLVYFSQRAIPPARLDHDQYALIDRFKKNYAGRGLYWDIDESSFEDTFRNHLALQMNALISQSPAASREASLQEPSGPRLLAKETYTRTHQLVVEFENIAVNLVNSLERLASLVVQKTQNDDQGTLLQHKINDAAWALKAKGEQLTSELALQGDTSSSFVRAVDDVYRTIARILNSREGNLSEVHKLIHAFQAAVKENGQRWMAV